MNVPLPRRFHLQRHEDVSGLSGVGVVAQGVEFSNGKVAITWISPYSSVQVWDSINVLERVHGHQGRTEVVWDDEKEQ